MPLNNRKIIGLVLLIKLPIALFLLIQFQLYYPAERVSGWFIQAGETPTFYQPVEHLAEGNGYSYDYETPVLQPSTRRLPGLVPVYLPVYWLMGKDLARNAMVVLQLLLDLLATVLVVKLA
ncbi:MAG: hypothetical protein AAGB22_15945, partial [Bacteroidota bacterium]